MIGANEASHFMLKRILLWLAAVLPFISLAGTFSTKCQGSWDDPGIWIGNMVPSKNDSIIINHAVYSTLDLEFNSYLRINEGGSLCTKSILTQPGSYTEVFGLLSDRSPQATFGGYVKVHKGGRVYSSKASYSGGGSIAGGWNDDWDEYPCEYFPFQELTCDSLSYTSPSGKVKYTASGEYLDTLPGSGGCDSILFVKVVISDTALTHVSLEGCKNQYFYEYDQSWDASGIYYDTVQSQYGCDSIVEINFQLLDCECILYLPNAFTPNGDGVNEIFIPQGFCDLTSYEMYIYSKNNIQIFYSEDLNKGWDGTFKGIPVPTGMYYYALKFTSVDGITNEKRGLLFKLQ